MSILFSKSGSGTVQVDDIEVDITMDDIVYELSKSEAEELIKKLWKKHRFNKQQSLYGSPLEEVFFNAIDRLKSQWYALSPMDESTIKQIAAKY
jgi:hypothetical protein